MNAAPLPPRDTLAGRSPTLARALVVACALFWPVALLARTRFGPASLACLCDAGALPRALAVEVALVACAWLVPLGRLRRALGPRPEAPEPPRRRLSRRKKALFASIVGLALGLALYAGSVCVRARTIYGRVKDARRGWVGGLHAWDPTLGFAPVPGSRGQELLPLGPPVEARYDAQGFRAPVEDALVQRAPGPCLLGIGCSFTYGDACRAEDTFMYRLGAALGRRAVNAGVGSYGLTQMLLVGRRRIPELKPGLVVLQYSPWLVDRAQTPLAPTFYGALTAPYLGQAPDGTARVCPPPFPTILFDLPIAEYLDTPRGAVDFASFFARVGLRMVVHDDVGLALLGLRRGLGLVPPPFADRRALVEQVYGELAELCRREGARLVVVLLGEVDPPGRAGLEAVRARTPFEIVDAWDALGRALPERTPEAFSRRYEHWAGDPPVCFDTHPNALAHALIADELRKAVTRGE